MYCALALVMLCAACSGAGIGNAPIGEVGYQGTPAAASVAAARSTASPTAAATASPGDLVASAQQGLAGAQATLAAAQAAAQAIDDDARRQALDLELQRQQVELDQLRQSSQYTLTQQLSETLAKTKIDAARVSEAQARAQAAWIDTQAAQDRADAALAAVRDTWFWLKLIFVGGGALTALILYSGLIAAMLTLIWSWVKKRIRLNQIDIRAAEAILAPDAPPAVAVEKDAAHLQAHKAAALNVVRWGDSFRDFGERTLAGRRCVVFKPDTDAAWVEGYRAYLGKDGWLRAGDDPPFGANERGATWWAPGWDLARFEREWPGAGTPPPPKSAPPRVPVCARSADSQPPQSPAEPAAPQLVRELDPITVSG